MTRLVLLVTLTVASGCAPPPEIGSVPQEQRTIEVTTSLPPAQALERVQASLLRGGWSVAEANSSMVSTDVYTLSTVRTFKVKLRANAITSGSGSVLYLTGIHGNVVIDDGTPKDPIVGGPFGRLNHAGPRLWAELERFAEAVRAAVK